MDKLRTDVAKEYVEHAGMERRLELYQHNSRSRFAGWLDQKLGGGVIDNEKIVAATKKFGIASNFQAQVTKVNATALRGKKADENVAAASGGVAALDDDRDLEDDLPLAATAGRRRVAGLFDEDDEDEETEAEKEAKRAARRRQAEATYDRSEKQKGKEKKAKKSG